MTDRMGTKIGMFRPATILRYNGDGTVRIGLDEGSLYGPPMEFDVPMPAAWMGPSGEFIGGYPEHGMSVVVSQGHGGQWFIAGYVNSDDVFDGSFVSSDDTLMSELIPGRALMQAANKNFISVDPAEGALLGNPRHQLQIDPNIGILSHNLKGEFSFTDASRKIDHVAKRDRVENLNRDVIDSTLESLGYEDSLFSVGLDPLSATSVRTSGTFVRNPAFIEKREVVYEFADSFGYSTDEEESFRYTDKPRKFQRPSVNKHNMRSNAFSLSLEYPNHLIETVKGTAVDSAGNILDINRVALPAGKTEELSLIDSKNKSSTHDKLRALERRSLCYHFEINVRKGGPGPSATSPPNVEDSSDYARDRSRFFIDIDKEGQFKINVPASSESGNIPLLTRYENYSTILARESGEVHPNEFVRNEENQDIFLEGVSSFGSIALEPGSEVKDEYARAVDRFTENEIKLGTAFHDITKTAEQFQEDAPFKQAGIDLVNFDSDNLLNKTVEQLPKIVSDTITVSGEDANAGGRSGTALFDGHISISIGANTIDRQSLWLDTAGGVVARYGKDKQGISYAGSMDGAVFMQIGGPGIGNSFDSRFEDQNDAYIDGTFDLRVLVGGETHIIRMDKDGVHVISAGRMTFSSQQNMIFRSRSHIIMEAELINLYGESSKRIVNRWPNNSIA